MNEIEQMYRNAGVERKKPACVECFLDGHSCNRTYDECPELYPPFTPEKQLEVIKVLAQKDYYTCDYCNIEPRSDNEEWLSYCHFKSCTKHTFEESLAALINNLWQDLAEDEKQKIREILKK